MNNCTAQTPGYSWAQKAGGTDFDEGRKLVVDAAGNTYVTGECRSTPVNFGSIVLPSAYNNFITKYSPAGTVLWAKKIGTGFGTDANNSITNIELDAAGNIYVIGGFYAGLVVGHDTVTSVSYTNNLYIAKYNADGVGLWVKNKTLNAVNPTNNINILKMKRVNAGRFVVIGNSQFADTIENIIQLKYPGYFIAVMDTAGTFTKGYPLVVDTAVSQPYTTFSDITTNSLGNIYLSGSYAYYNTEIDTTHWNLPPNTTYNKSYIAKFDSSLNFQWAKTNDYSPHPFWTYSANNVNYSVITSDDEDNVYQAGEFFADTMYYGNFQVYGWNMIVKNFSSYIGGGDLFLVKLDGAGTVQWLKSYTSNTDEYPRGICNDKLGNIYLTGVCAGSTSFDNLTTGNAALNSPLFVTKITSAGNVAWLQGAGNCNVYSKTIGEDGRGNVIIAGGFAACDPGFGSFNLVHYPPAPNTGAEDMFTARIGNCNMATPVVVQHDDTLYSSVTAGFYQWYFNGHMIPGAGSQNCIIQTSGNYALAIADSLGCYSFSTAQNFITGTLPLTLLNLTAAYKNDEVIVHWQTANEINTNRFIVQRSANGIKFYDIGIVAATGNSSNTYTFPDMNTGNSSLLYYRLKMADDDEKFSYSKIVSVKRIQQQLFTLSPNPANGSVTLYFNRITEAGTVSIYNTAGAEILNTPLKPYTNTFTVNTQSLPAGIYIVQIKMAAGIYHDQLLISK